MPRGKRAEQAENGAKTPAPGHNSGELTDDQKQLLWTQGRDKIITFRKQMETITAGLRNEYKKLKAELKVTKAEVDFGLACRNDDDDKLLESERRRQMLARWEGHAIGTQASLFDIDRTPAVDRAYADGKRAGLAGETCKPPFDPSVPQHQEFIRGFHDGNAVLAGGIKAPKFGAQGDAHLAAEAEKRKGAEAVDALVQ